MSRVLWWRFLVLLNKVWECQRRLFQLNRCFCDDRKRRKNNRACLLFFLIIISIQILRNLLKIDILNLKKRNLNKLIYLLWFQSRSILNLHHLIHYFLLFLLKLLPFKVLFISIKWRQLSSLRFSSPLLYLPLFIQRWCYIPKGLYRGESLRKFLALSDASTNLFSVDSSTGKVAKVRVVFIRLFTKEGLKKSKLHILIGGDALEELATNCTEEGDLLFGQLGIELT